MILPERSSVCVDLSAKVEAWDRLSVVVVSNGYTYALRLPSAVKTALREALRDGRDLPQYAIFAAAIFLALRPNLTQVRRIRVDLDYSGETAKRAVRRLLLGMIRRDLPTFKASAIRIEEVAGSNADVIARLCYLGKRKTDGEITLAEIEDVLRGTE